MSNADLMQNLKLREATENDIPALDGIAAAMRATHEAGYFARSLREGRTVLLAEQAGAAVGYVQVNWKPNYVPFRRLNIPEIQDLNVVPAARQQGIGDAMVAACENLAREKGHEDMGISVGLYAGYGAAQRLYVRRGYVPDGAGISYDDMPVTAGEMRAVDDLLTLKLVKSLGQG
ncbi:MAG: acetyltransferase, family [Alphaproteobacteria bacterium]|jgi:GNAT superfamily N-acetyltransferase|nr:acetyltransferase, family [Alphaproteobacteria bacterium]